MPNDERLRIRCGHCNKTIAVPATMSGKRIKCPSCSKAIPVPTQSRHPQDEDSAPSPTPTKQERQIPRPIDVPKMKVTLLGDNSGNTLLAQIGCLVSSNTRPNSGDLVLLAVSVCDGLSPTFIDILNEANGFQADRVALLLTGFPPDFDNELAELVEMELRDLLTANDVFEDNAPDRLACFRTDDTRLDKKLAAWAKSPPQPLLFFPKENWTDDKTRPRTHDAATAKEQLEANNQPQLPGDVKTFQMTILFYCGECKALIRAKNEVKGRQGKCQKCGSRIKVPEKSDDGAIARQLAKEFWNSPAAATAKATGLGNCDYCKGDVAIGQGFLISPPATDDIYPNIACSECFSKNRRPPWNGDVSRMALDHAQAFAIVSKTAREFYPTPSVHPEKATVNRPSLMRAQSNAGLREFYEAIGFWNYEVSECDLCGILLPNPAKFDGWQTKMRVALSLGAVVEQSSEPLSVFSLLIRQLLGEEFVPVADTTSGGGMQILASYTKDLFGKLCLSESTESHKMLCPLCLNPNGHIVDNCHVQSQDNDNDTYQLHS